MAVAIDQILDLIRETGGVEAIGPDADFYEAGFSSIKALNLLLELETLADVSIPDDRFIASRTPRALALLVTDLQAEAGG